LTGGGVALVKRLFHRAIGSVVWGLIIFLYAVLELILGAIGIGYLWGMRLIDRLKRGDDCETTVLLCESEDSGDLSRKLALHDYIRWGAEITKLRNTAAPNEAFFEIVPFCQYADAFYAETHVGEHFLRLEQRILGILDERRRHRGVGVSGRRRSTT